MLSETREHEQIIERVAAPPQYPCEPCLSPWSSTGSNVSPYADKIVLVESSTSTDTPLELHGCLSRHAQ